MKYLLTLFALLLSGCDGILNTLDAQISMTAKQHFVAAGGNAIEVVEANAVAPVRTAARIRLDALGNPTGVIEFDIGTQCVQWWDVSVISGYESFWLGVGANAPASWYVTYDASERQCTIAPERRYCGGNYTAVMDMQTAVVTIGCETR